jgi:protein-L-isoaspartate(D-aspartate) O-methyltransferase
VAPTDRDRLVDRLIDEGAVSDPRVVAVLREVPRELFLPPEHGDEAYLDRPLPIGHGQTISAPHMVALMAEHLALRPGLRVLEVGTGSGYHAAVTARLIRPGGRLTSIEFVEELAATARENLRRAGETGVEVVGGDGARGWPAHAPYDRIYLTCAAARFPPPLLAQLADDGWILGPIGGEPARLVRARRAGGAWIEEDLGACAFVPLRGEFGRE